MTHVRCEVILDERTFKIKLSQDCTVSQLMIKIRAYLKLKPEKAYFLFFEQKGLIYNTERLYAGSKTLAEVKMSSGLETQKIRLLRDSTFGALNSRFEKATIDELKDGSVWILKIEYSYYNLYNFQNVFVYKTLDECIKKLAVERCDSLTVTNKQGELISIDPPV